MTTTTSSLHLAPILDISMAATLKQALEGPCVRGETVLVNAADVQRISSLCLQVLLAAAKTGTLRFSAVSPAFRETTRRLALASALGLSEQADG